MGRFWTLAAGLAAIMFAGTGGALAKEPARIMGKPNLNGIWQAMNGAFWNVEPHGTAGSTVAPEKIGAIGAIPADVGVVAGGQIPYLPDALTQRNKNRAGAPTADPEASCFLPGIPRATYMNYPFQIVQSGNDDLLFVYSYANANRIIEMKPVEVPPIDTWMGTSYGAWEGDTLKVTTLAQNGMTWLDRAGNYLTNTATVTERFKPLDSDHIQYEATIEDPSVYSKPWKISMVLYRNVEPNAQLLEFNCVPFSEDLIYGDLKPGRDAKK